nr:DsbA family protein [Ruegeria sp. HKCCD8929]
MSIGAPVASADERSEAEVKRLALEAILENPEIIMQAVEILQQREDQAKAEAAGDVLSNQRELLEQDPNAPVIGNPDGDVTVVEFFDYNCPYCKRAASVVKGVIGEDTQLRVVYREWPILGEGSVFAARAALAARNQGRYEEFHWALMDLKGRAGEASVMKVVLDLGLDEDRLRDDMHAPEVDAHIQVSMDLANQLGFSGTPSFVIGDALAPGLVPIDEMKRLIKNARDTQ